MQMAAGRNMSGHFETAFNDVAQGRSMTISAESGQREPSAQLVSDGQA